MKRDIIALIIALGFLSIGAISVTGQLNATESKIQPTQQQQQETPIAPQDRKATSEEGSVRPNGAAGQQSPSPTATPLQQSPGQMPEDVLRTVQTQLRGAFISGSTRETNTIYEVTLISQGRERTLHFLQDGSLVTQEAQRQQPTTGEFSMPLEDAQRVQFDGVPEAVRKALTSRAGDNRVQDLKKGSLASMVLYEASYQKNGEQVTVRLSEDGSLTGMRREPQATQTDRPAGEEVAENQIPAAVRQAVESYVPQAEITSARQHPVQLFNIEVVRNGQPVRLRVTDDGSMVHPLRTTAVEGSPQLGSARQSNEEPSQLQEDAGGRKGGFIVPLSDATEVSYEQLPEPVRRTALLELPNAQFGEIKKGQWSGRTIYEIAAANGEQANRIQISEDGTLIQAAAGAAAPSSEETEQEPEAQVPPPTGQDDGGGENPK